MVTNLMKYNPAFLGDEALIRSFVARTSELQRILEVFRENTTGSNQHLLVIGPRGIGKTTLVLRAAAEIRADPSLGAHWYPVVYGEETYQVSSAGEFWLEALFHVGQQTEDARWQQAHEELLGERNEKRLRPRALAQLMDFADEHGKRLVLVVENLNMLFGGQIGDEDAWVLRHTLMNEPRIMLIGTATSRFRVMDEYNQALYELFRIMELEPLADADAHAVWAAATGQTVPRHQLRPIQILTGGNPRLIRILSEFAAKTSFRLLMDDLTRLVDEHTEYFKHHLDNLAPQERKVFVVLADLWDPSTARAVADTARLDVNVTSALLKRLVDRGAVTTPYKRGRAQYYQVAERMYNIYHLMRRRGPAASRVHAVVRFMVSLYRDEELVRTTRSLVEEASRLSAEQRREHLIACEAIIMQARGRRVAKQLVDATRFAFQSMPDVPDALRRMINIDTPTEHSHRTDAWSDNIERLLSVPMESLDDVELLLNLGNVLAEDIDQHAKAEAAFSRAVELAPQNATAWRTFGMFVENQLQRHEEALIFFDRALALDPDYAPTWFAKGKVLDLLDRDEEALAAFGRASELDPANASTWTQRGSSLLWLSRAEEAIEAFDRALQVSQEDPYTWWIRGVALNIADRPELALDSFERVLDLNPQDADAWVGIGAAYNRLERKEEALKAVDRALTLDPENSSAWSEKGDILDNKHQFEDALVCYGRAVSLDPEDAFAWSMQGSLLAQLGRTEEALEAIDRALHLDPEVTFSLGLKGQVLSELGRFEEALTLYNSALAIAEDGVLLCDRAMLYWSLGRLEEAENDLRRATSLDASDTGAAGALIELLLKDVQKPQEAMMIANKILSGPARSAETLNEIAWVFFKYGRKEDWAIAEIWARDAVQQEPGDGAFRHTWACLLGAHRQWDAALEQARFFLQDADLLDESFDEVVDFLVDAVAVGLGNQVLPLLMGSGDLERFEPLVVAIRHLNGQETDVAREIVEIASDVIHRIDTRRSEIL